MAEGAIEQKPVHTMELDTTGIHVSSSRGGKRRGTEKDCVCSEGDPTDSAIALPYLDQLPEGR